MKLLLLFLIFAAELFGQNSTLPNNPLEGRIVFEEKGCIECHAIGGYGGNVGPDLIKKQYYGSFLQLTSVIWNHIPQMNRMFRKLHRDKPNFTASEMMNLISFIYYLRYLGEPGSVSNGKKLLQTKGCLDCHSVESKGGKGGPDFTKTNQFASSLFMAQSMWNHFPAMSKQLLKSGRQIPSLSGKDLVDISAYVKAASASSKELRMTPGNPNNGGTIFKLKGCIKCHSVDKEKKDKLGPALHEIKLNLNVTEIAALMWNHAESMAAYMKNNSIKWPVFKGTEMADLIAYLYFLGFEDPPGNALKGETTFTEKKCALCHSQDGGVGPNLTKGYKLSSPVYMIQKMWNHASKMEDQILTLNEEWPKLSADEMRNIYAFLKKN